MIVTAVMLIPLSASGLLTAAESGEVGQGQAVFGLILAFIFYFLMYTVIIFSNTALVGATLMRLNGEDPTVRDGFRIASERIGTILGYAGISATVGVILSIIRGDEDNFVGQIAASILGTAWNIITFLVIPVLVVENISPIDAIKRSGGLLRKTWGEQLVGTFSINAIFGLITFAVILFVGVPMFMLAGSTSSVVVIFVAVAIVVLLVMAISLLGAALNGVFQAALYKYATEGEVVSEFQGGLVSDAFQQKGHARI
jgi:hypothetical protein